MTVMAVTKLLARRPHAAVSLSTFNDMTRPEPLVHKAVQAAGKPRLVKVKADASTAATAKLSERMIVLEKERDEAIAKLEEMGPVLKKWEDIKASGSAKKNGDMNMEEELVSRGLAVQLVVLLTVI